MEATAQCFASFPATGRSRAHQLLQNDSPLLSPEHMRSPRQPATPSPSGTGRSSPSGSDCSFGQFSLSLSFTGTESGLSFSASTLHESSTSSVVFSETAPGIVSARLEGTLMWGEWLGPLGSREKQTVLNDLRKHGLV